MPKIVDHAERRREIANTSLDLIANSGISAVTFRGVADASGWSVGVIGHYFTNRHDLLFAALTRAAEVSAEHQRSISRNLEGRQALEAILEESLPADSRRLALTRIFLFFYAEAVTDDAVRQEISKFLHRWRRQTEIAVKQAQALGDIDPTLTPANVAADLIAYADGLGIQALYSDELMARVLKSSPVREWVSHLRPKSDHWYFGTPDSSR